MLAGNLPIIRVLLECCSGSLGPCTVLGVEAESDISSRDFMVRFFSVSELEESDEVLGRLTLQIFGSRRPGGRCIHVFFAAP
jgi:hypothetical protein